MKRLIGLTLLGLYSWSATAGISLFLKAPEAPASFFLMKDFVGFLPEHFQKWVDSSKDTQLVLVINSDGGQIVVGEEIIKTAEAAHRNNRTFLCKVEKAVSMAYGILNSVCDQIVLRPGSKLLWHQPYWLGGKLSLEETKLVTAELEKQHQRMLELIAPTFTDNLNLFAKSYATSQVWTGIQFWATFKPPQPKWQMEVEDVSFIPK